MEENGDPSPALLTSCLALDKSLNLSEPELSHLEIIPISQTWYPTGWPAAASQLRAARTLPLG